ncbi:MULTISPECIES: aminoacyl--tRNA ligase-related protein [Oceanobacillus]|uniref:aminoacyl--tRNA ligase-related protein n=2 Tax=Bacillaceae TaxID=186817 RepID=UPI000BA7997F|nr:aminoacyl--tRNA ligase-related protein [Oceanobacillus profundus]PAE28218.1 hypothetical protein CHI07_15665 [Paenibacillus sp. 7884-2]
MVKTRERVIEMEYCYSTSSIKTKDIPELINRIYLLSIDVTNVTQTDRQLIVTYEGDQEKSFHENLNRLIMEKDRQIRKKVIDENNKNLKVYGDFIHPVKEEEGISYKGDIALLFEGIRKQFDLLAQKYNATYTKYPSIMSEKLMKKTNYAFHFPQNTYRVFEIKHQKENLEKYRLYSEYNLDTGDLFQSSDYYLRPCLCYFAYNDREDQSLSDELEVVSSFGQCFRHENNHQISPYRSRDFNMYEIIYLGCKEKVTETRDHLLEEVIKLFDQLGLKGKVETANDPFFMKEDRNKIAYQRAGERKYELIFSPNKEISYSVASFNLCDHVITESFNISTNKGDLAYSGCTAFGVERWVQAIVYTYGTNRQQWPECLQELIKNG